MIVLGRAYKENLVLGISMAVVAVGLFLVLGIVLWAATIARIILSTFFFAFSLFCFVFFSTLIILQLLTADDVILYDRAELKIIVRRYRSQYEIALKDIAEIKYYNKGLLSIGPIFFRQELDYGKIGFHLSGGKKIISPNVVKIRETYKSLIDLLAENREDSL